MTQKDVLTKNNGMYSIKIVGGGKRLAYFGQKENILSDAPPPIFRLRFLNDDGSFSVYTADSANVVSMKEEDDSIIIAFSGFDVPMCVELRVDCPQGEAFSYWKLKVHSEKQLEWAEYPCVSLKDRFKGKGNASLLWTYNEGALTNDIDNHTYLEPEYPSCGSYAMYPGMLFAPFIACVDENEGLYLGATDGGDTRHIDFYREGDGVRLLMREYPGICGGEYQSKKDTLLGVFQGDWYVATEIYRKTFEENKDERFIKIKDNTSLPDWYKKSPVVLTYCVRGHHDLDELTENKMFPYTNALPIIDKYAQELNSPIMVILMHWEGTAPWAPPYVWPPYGGEKALRDFIDQMHARGNVVGVYCSGLGWTQTSNLCEYSQEAKFDADNLVKVMNTASDGSVPLSKICTAQRSGYDLCISQDFTKRTLKEEVRKMARAGIDYIQLMDQNHGGTPYMCYSREHGHPPVPGKWQSDALNALLREILSENRNLVLGCESASSEVFIPNLLFSDNRYGLNYRYGLPVPAYAYVYHEYVNNFMGNNVLGDRILNCYKEKQALAYRNAYSFIAGDLLTLVINDEGEMQWAWIQRDFSKEYMPEQEQNKAFVRILNEWRQACPEFLLEGRMLPLPTYVCKKHRLAIYQGDQDVDTVLGGVFQASNGKKALFLVNWTGEKQTVRLNRFDSITIWSTPTQREIIVGDVLELSARSVIMVEL